jgi:5'-nucleotidase
LQVQIAGARVVIDCEAQPDPLQSPGIASHIYIGAVDPAMPCTTDADCCVAAAGCTSADQVLGACDINTARCWQPMDPIGSYELATSNYLSTGGSGFRVLQRNTTQFDTQIQQRDALIDYIRGGKACGAKDDGTLWPCATDGDCLANLGDGYVCACTTNALEGEQCLSDPAAPCPLAAGEPGPGDGACVLARCRDDVAAFERQTCDGAVDVAVQQSCDTAITPCARGGEECKFLACLDKGLGNSSDGRVRMVGR